MILRVLLHFLIYAAVLNFASAHEFRCNDLLDKATNPSLRTFEYTNPKTKLRGVACVSLLNNEESLLMYLEEDTKNIQNDHKHKHKRKQAVGRAQLQSPSPPGTHFYSGVIHVTHNIADNHEDLFDLDNFPFTISVALDTGLVSFSIKSQKSPDSIVYMWQPRISVPKWSMHVDIPESCGIKSYKIADPIPRTTKDRDGIVCVLEESASVLRFYSLGWRKSGYAGKPRKFVDFGSLRVASPNFLNIYTGRIHRIAFPCHCHLKHDRKTFKESSIITAVRSPAGTSLMIYGDLKEEWHDTKTQIDPFEMPRYPLLPINLQTDFSADLRQIYGISGNK